MRWTHPGATSWDSKCNLTWKHSSSEEAKEERSKLPLLCVSACKKPYMGQQKKLRSLFLCENNDVAAMWFCKLHGTFDARVHLSRGKGQNRIDKRNR